MHTEHVIKDTLLTVEIKDYNVMIDGRNFFDQAVKRYNNIGNILKIATGDGDAYTKIYLLYYPYFKEKFKLIGIEQQISWWLYKAIKQVSFTRNLDQAGNKTMFLILEELKKFFTRNLESTVNLFCSKRISTWRWLNKTVWM